MSPAPEDRLPAGWVRTTLEFIVAILDGQRVPVNASERATRTGSVPYYGATGRVGWIDKPLFDETLVLLGEDGAPFLDKTRPVSYVISGQSWVNNHAHVLRALLDINSSLLRHQLNTVDYRPFISGTTRMKLSQAPMRRIPLLLPAAAEQSRIADALDELFSDLDAGVAALERARKKLKLYRASVLKAAVEGALTVEWRKAHPDAEPASVLLERILAERRRRWEQDQLARFKAKGQTPPANWMAKYKPPAAPDTTNLPPLPAGWCWATVEQCSRALQYGTSAKTGSSGTVPVLRMGNITINGSLVLDDLKYLPMDHQEFPELLLDSNDLLFNRTNSAELVGKTAVFRGVPKICSFASYLIRVRLVEGVVPETIVHAINGGFGRAWIRSILNQTVGQANVNGTKLASFSFPLPPSAEQLAIVDLVEDQLSVIDHMEAELEAKLKEAGTLRQAILRHAFSGKLVPQDPDDEPASELLARIAADRASRPSAARGRRGSSVPRVPSVPSSPRGQPARNP